ncbi:hypothetical protein [Jiella pelagia]|uniref:Relaxase/Mobilisation nuclease domain-containing protein n=1 Tax=Jiella pelagia TaxID=2986949 RepID=A0ABY7C188_9HYPH|nr:hypothetical protein [Jiella pelagia]WAP69862.1 hypothetical protein OH818_06630 [Jiella pelagia]
MIVKAYRLWASWRLNRFSGHIFRGTENDHIRVLRGSERDLAFFQATARRAGRKFGVRHIIFSPAGIAHVDDFLGLIDLAAGEFSFDPAVCVAVLHTKQRRSGNGHLHLHLLVPEVDPVSGKSLSSSFSFLRHEKMARIGEYRLGEPFLRGRHLKPVAARLKKENRTVWDALIKAFPDLRPGSREGFSHPLAARAKREADVDLPEVRNFLRTVWQRSNRSVDMTKRAIAQMGLTLKPGNKRGIILLMKGDTQLGALHRLLDAPSKEIGRSFGDDRPEAEFGRHHPRGHERNLETAEGFRKRGGEHYRAPHHHRNPARHSEGTGGRAERAGGAASATGRAAVHPIGSQPLPPPSRLDRAELLSQRKRALDIAEPAFSRCLAYIDEQKRAVTQAQNRVRFDESDLLDEEAAVAAELRLAHDRVREMKTALRTLEKEEAASKSKQRGTRWWNFFRPHPKGADTAKPRLEAARMAKENAEKISSELRASLSRIRERREGRAYHHHLTKAAEEDRLKERMEALLALRTSLVREPDLAYKGLSHFKNAVAKLGRRGLPGEGIGEPELQGPRY